MQLTTEQMAIIEHDGSHHATVLAVAGAGKTTTMVHRIVHLLEKGWSAPGIRAVMYNASARTDFSRKLDKAGVADVKVQTFHAMGYGILRWAQTQKLIPDSRLLSDGREVRTLARLAMRAVLEGQDQQQQPDVDEVLSAISTWKSMLTPPDEALHLREPQFVKVYAEFERQRRKQRLLTFDDQIYDAVRLLERDSGLLAKLTNRLDHLILDEFQDVNHARLRLAKLLAGERARVMVVGDDDQCIYEWQGARSSFIKRGFENEFSHHPHSKYRLTRSFRFGPLIAQIAANVIGHNTDRVEKDLVADQIDRPGMVTLHHASEGGGVRQALPVVRKLLQDGAMPNDIVILVRKYSQSFLIQGLLLANKIPFIVEGARPLKNSLPIKVALAYIDVVSNIDVPLNEDISSSLEYIVQRPSRYVKKAAFQSVVTVGINSGCTAQELLANNGLLREHGLAGSAIENLSSLGAALNRAKNKATAFAKPEGKSGQPDGPSPTAGDAIMCLMQDVPFKDYFQSFEGAAAAEDDLAMMNSFGTLLAEAGIGLVEARPYVESLDTSLGQPETACIKITSIFKAKGLEWHHVLLPDLVEGQSPDLRSVVNVCINRNDPSRNPDPTETLESERRLFYVALTRAEESLHLFADPTSQRPLSRFVHEAQIQTTTTSINSLQTLHRGSPVRHHSIRNLVVGARSDARLRDGLLNMLRRISQHSTSAHRHWLSRATVAVNNQQAIIFAYPNAYPDSVTDQTMTEANTGLPF